MEPRRILQTTLVHPMRPEFSVTALFVGAAFSKNTDVDGVNAALGIEPVSGGSISEAELKRVLASILTDNFAVFDMAERAFTIYVNEADIDMDFLDLAVHRDYIVVDRGSPRSETLAALSKSAFGATLGLFSVPDRVQFHDVTGSPKIELLTLVMPYGILACGSQRGIGRALSFGLYERLHRSLTL